MTDFERSITGYARSVRELLANKRYGLEFYQREYSWGRAQVEELVTDLTARFGDQFDEGHSRQSVAKYRQYFLGPIITSDRDGTSYLIDGQQRLTTLTLLLIVLLHRLEDDGLRSLVRSLIYSEEYGKKTLTLDVPEREEAFESLIEQRFFDTSDASESVQQVVARHADLEEMLELDDPQLPLFAEWLLGKVILVEIIAPESQMAYDIFETMNDRGLRLTPTDMLKGYLLASIEDDELIEQADAIWRRRVQDLAEAKSDADADFFKAWLRAHYAETIRERKRGAAAEDWDLIGTQFHKWVRDNKEAVGLKATSDFDVFVTRSFPRMSSHYLRMVAASATLTPGLEHVRYNAATGYSLQLTVALSPVTEQDDDEIANAKMELVARYLDIFVARRIVNFRNYGYSPTYYTMFQLAKRLRHRPLDELADLLRDEAARSDDTFADALNFGLHMRNGPQVRYILARLTDFIHVGCGNEPMFDALMSRDRKDPFEIEHVWANHFERHTTEFEHEADFTAIRNRLGDLLLVPKSFNSSYSDLTYEEKLPRYLNQNLLASTLHPATYRNNPNLHRFITGTGLEVKPHEIFDREAIAQRQQLYLEMAALIWDSDRLLGLPL